MQFSSMLDNEPPAFDFGPAFQYRSAFKYSRIAGSENEYADECSVNRRQDSGNKVFNWYQKLLRSFFLVSTYSAFIATFPLSFWFCVKKVKALERCVIFRLGQRLPLQGPGYVVTFPCFDVVDIIDLSPQTFKVTDNEQPILTSDGSIVQLREFEVTIAVADAVKSFTQIKDSKANIQKFIRVAFQNMISGSHVEDLERKIDWIVKEFVANCTKDIQRWGWEMTGNTIPKVVVVSRAEPTNPLVETLKSYFSGNSAPDASDKDGNDISIEVDSDPVPDPYAAALQSVAGRFMALRMMGISSVVLSLEIQGEPVRLYQFNTSTGKIDSIAREVDKVDVRIKAASVQQFGLAIQANDYSMIEIEQSLF